MLIVVNDSEVRKNLTVIFSTWEAVLQSNAKQGLLKFQSYLHVGFNHHLVLITLAPIHYNIYVLRSFRHLPAVHEWFGANSK